MAPGGTLFRFPPHFGENVLLHGSHEWLPYSKDEVRLKTVNNNLPDLLRLTGRLQSRIYTKLTEEGSLQKTAYEISALTAQILPTPEP